jgi:ADP-dependent NAD(P)H-hydrate dehydratase / NAD(P)H-hydrate epimerase
MSPVPIAPDGGPWPLHDSLASRAAEAAALADAPAQALMERAGLAVAQLALALAPHARSVQVYAGPGNNGGDGLVAARHLHRAGKATRVTLCADADRLPADAAVALQRARDAGVPIGTELPAGSPDFGIDALLGLGARRAPAGLLAAAIARINDGAMPVLAVDLPSGLHPDTGQPLGASVVKASDTLALLTLKPGLFTAQGRDLAGAVWLDRLGTDAAGATAWLTGPARTAPRPHASHKGRFGDVAVVGGAPGMVGAAVLAARAALAAGAGRVYVGLLDAAAPTLDPQRPELMFRPRWWAATPAVIGATTVVCGCGGGDAVRAVLPPMLGHAARLLLDADALNAVALDTGLQRLLEARRARGLDTVLTPHPLEAARLLGRSAADVQADRLVAAQALADRFGATVVLKGSGSVVTTPAGQAAVNPSGNALLATAGTGDVLAGWIGGLWAQGGDGAAAARAGVWWHGHAADLAARSGQRRPLLAADLIDAMRRR